MVIMHSLSGMGQYNGSVAPPESLAPGFASMTEEQSREWLSILAGPGFEGRGTGQLGYVRAAHWVAGKVAEFGLEPKGESGTYFQMLPMTRQSIDDGESLLVASDGTTIKMNGNFGLDQFADLAEVTGKLTFLKLVGNIPRIEENTLTDKIVICDR
jgi:hypothetical protein